MPIVRLRLSIDREMVLAYRTEEVLPIDSGFVFLQERFPNRVTAETISLTELVARIRFPGPVKKHEAQGYGLELRKHMEKVFSMAANSPEKLMVEELVDNSADTAPDASDGRPYAREEEKPPLVASERHDRVVGIMDSVTEKPSKASPVSETAPKPTAAPAPASASGNSDSAGTQESIENLLGADVFKALAAELRLLAPMMKQHGTVDAFLFQNYLFSIGDGCGLTTALNLFAEMVSELGLFTFKGEKKVQEIHLAPPGPDGGRSELDEAAGALGGYGSGGRLVCLDISEWIPKLKDAAFRRFLMRLDALEDKFLFVFRVPYLDRDTLQGIQDALGDVLFMREVAFPPLDGAALAEAARRTAVKAGFTLEAEAWQLFENRMAEEKSDGRFYGMNTVRKVIREMIYRTYRTRLVTDKNTEPENAGTPRPVEKLSPEEQAERIIRATDLTGFTRAQVSGGEDARTQLDRLIGLDTVKRRIDEILAQISYARQHPDMGVPCLHMRFVGNPGTGKTTVARLLGQMMAERGILRNGLFFEHAGRDFCGRYIGETAPKTAAICRDAYGSVLFIDEAYSLFRGEDDTRDYGREALDTLIAEMENHRTDLVVIMAGYPDEMETLLKGNSGLAGRMPFLIEFPNYGRDDLKRILRFMLEGRTGIDEGFLGHADAWFDTLPDSLLNSRAFSNARFVRNLFERTWGKAAMRAQLEGSRELRLTVGDFVEASGEREFTELNKSRRERIGFIA